MRKRGMQSSISSLEFTGNWFIDAGILGFANLMEEVYEWKLEELQNKIQENPELVYYWYFPIAFIFYNNKLRGKSIELRFSPPQVFESRVDLFEKAWVWISSKKEFVTFTSRTRKKRIDLSFKKPFNYFTNFLFFQPGWDIDKQKRAFMEILRLEEVKSDKLKYIDKTINKFLPSADEFSNVPYSRSFMTLENLLNFHPYSLVFTLTFPIAFIRGILREDILFYSPNLEFTYYVNKRLIKLLEKVEYTSRIIQITWRAVIDSIVETQSIWTLENMYLVKYRLGGRQDILNAEYIGIPKLQASFILDDTIRDVLEEFIKNKPLLPHIINYLHEDLNNKLNKNERVAGTSTLIYIDCVDAQLKEFGLKNANNGLLGVKLFGDEFFIRYREILFRFREKTKEMFSIAGDVRKIFKDRKERERTASKLLSTIRKRNKYAFTNILLKSLIGRDERQEIRFLNRYLFEKIVLNNINWENYALAIVIGLVYGGGESGEGEAE